MALYSGNGRNGGGAAKAQEKPAALAPAAPAAPLQARDPDDASPLVHLSTDFIRAKEYLEAIVASTSDSICTTDMKGRLIYFSPGAQRMLGIKASAALGRRAHEFYEDGRQEAERIMQRLLKEKVIESHEVVLKAKDGRRIHVSMAASLLRDRAGRLMGTLGICKDISRHVELERRLREMSITDNLTELYNQRYFHERLSQEARRARRQGYELSMVLMDLDGFKKANDRLGHLEGDRILKIFASAVSASIRQEVDSAFRYGGDEFVVLMPALNAAQARRVAYRISAAARSGLKRSGVSFSYGIATLPSSGKLADFVKEADHRMFRMKNAKKRRQGGSRRKNRA